MRVVSIDYALAPENPFFGRLERMRAESVVAVEGEVVARDAETANPNLATGQIELRVTALEVLSEAEELPLPVFGEPDYPEELRLRHRYLDLRRETLHRNIALRSAVVSSLRRRMTDAGFTEFQTPILTAASPEGARDFLVPNRLHPGKFYALPQAPQQFKQLLMIAGFDRYFQIVRCFRDEDQRADRQLEFTQIDLEMSFVGVEDVLDVLEELAAGVFEQVIGVEIQRPFGRISSRSCRSKGRTPPQSYTVFAAPLAPILSMEWTSFPGGKASRKSGSTRNVEQPCKPLKPVIPA